MMLMTAHGEMTMSNFYTQELDFKPIKGFEHEYAINKNGRILSLLTDQIANTSVDTNGYLMVNLYKDGKRYAKRVHILVAQAFIPNPDNLPVVNHIDGNKTNPNVTNLEWCTYSENTQHAHRTGLQDKTSNKEVVREDGKRYASLTEAAKDTGISKSAISKVLHGVRVSAGGYRWKYGGTDEEKTICTNDSRTSTGS